MYRKLTLTVLGHFTQSNPKVLGFKDYFILRKQGMNFVSKCVQLFVNSFASLGFIYLLTWGVNS